MDMPCTQNYLKSGNSLCHFIQALSIFFGTASSHNRWWSIFIWIVMGEYHLKTSNKWAMFDTSTCFVKGSGTTEQVFTGWKQSDDTFLSTPKGLVHLSWWWISCLVFGSFKSRGMLAKTSPSTIASTLNLNIPFPACLIFNNKNLKFESHALEGGHDTLLHKTSPSLQFHFACWSHPLQRVAVTFF